MPFTPFHMGPGILIKAVLQGSFSLMVFGWAQILMDIQPLIVLLTGEGELHGFSHTFIGASLIATVAVVTGKPLSELGLKIIGVSPMDAPINISWKVATASALIGTYSHVVLDAVMHGDVKPYYPFVVANDMHGFVSVTALHQFCLYTAALGGIIFFLVQLSIRTKSHANRSVDS
ncbi:MAG: hypothetical protein ACWA5Q_02225 [bacterium]